MAKKQEKKSVKKKTKDKTVLTIGKRKKSVARAYVKKGSGVVRINTKPLKLIQPRYVRMRIQEPLMLANDVAKGLDITVRVKGGGIWGQADAVRTAIGNALVKFDPSLKQKFLDYDRTILVSDSRRTEPHKPSRSSAGPRRKKQQSKR